MTVVARWVENHRASPSFDGGHVLLGLKVRGRTQRTPSMEMPPGKLERAKPLACGIRASFSKLHIGSLGAASSPECRVDRSGPALQSNFSTSAARPFHALAEEPFLTGRPRFRGKCDAQRGRRGGRSDTGGCNNSPSSAISRSLAGDASIGAGHYW